ncbi:uncharacterized protein TNCV_2864621 [Trichonephila clavipes]|nr:uncharacterized protein TNCV_2864621 [Trichonephila clavipes]
MELGGNFCMEESPVQRNRHCCSKNAEKSSWCSRWNEASDDGACASAVFAALLTTKLHFARLNTRIKPLGLPIPPEHHWYQCSRPRGYLAHRFTKQDQILLACFRERSGHIKTMKFYEGCKNFEMCTNCSFEPASPAHILESLGLTKKDLVDNPLLVLDFLKVFDVMDLSSIADQWRRAATKTTQPLSSLECHFF